MNNSFKPNFKFSFKEDLPYVYFKILLIISVQQIFGKEVRFEAGWFRYECISVVPVLLKGPNADDIKKPTVQYSNIYRANKILEIIPKHL